jgi:serine O-acetyltransferase
MAGAFFTAHENQKIMTFQQYLYLVFSDFFRMAGSTSFTRLLRNVVFGEAFQLIFWMRTCKYMRRKPLLRYTLYPLALFLYNHYTYKFGIGIPFETEIGPGFFIGHFGCIFVHPDCCIGKNCNLSQGVSIGVSNRGEKKGCPTIGDNVYIGPGAKIFGAIHIGNHAAIGANCVVTKDVPDNAVVVGIPGKVISLQGSDEYITHTAYEGKLADLFAKNKFPFFLLPKDQREPL